MNIQSIIAFLIFAAAGAYLGRNFWRSLRGFLSGKSGCSEGCGKCAFAAESKVTGGKPAPARRPDIIALGDIKTLPAKPEKR